MRGDDTADMKTSTDVGEMVGDTKQMAGAKGCWEQR